MKPDDVVNKLIQHIESGSLPWKRPWKSSSVSGLPANPSTKREYSGTNILSLWVEQAVFGYETGLWLGFDQARKLGGHVKKDEHGHPVLVYRTGTRTNDEGNEEAYRFLSVRLVFNLDQCAGLDSLRPVYEKHEWDPLERVESLIQKTGATIEYGGDRAFYLPKPDKIRLPDRDRFANAKDFSATALHELTHWTGHESRLNRKFGQKFGEDAYAFEELIAEIGCAMTMARIGLSGEVVNHASYLDHWLKVLRQKPSYLFTAASAASKASDWLVQP